MTDAEWTACDDPARLLKVLTHRQLFGDSPSASQVPTRKLQLLWAGAARRLLPHVAAAKAARCLDLRERLADGLATPAEVVRASKAVKPAAGETPLAEHARGVVTMRGTATPDLPLHAAAVAAVFAARPDLTGFPAYQRLDAAAVDELRRPERAAQAALIRCVFGNPFLLPAVEPAWLTAAVVGLAEAVYADRAFDRLPVLADALQDAGCEDAAILSHCRGGGPHARGCWVVDVVLGRK